MVLELIEELLNKCLNGDKVPKIGIYDQISSNYKKEDKEL